MTQKSEESATNADNTKVPRVGALTKVSSIRKEVGKVYREARKGTLPPDKASKLVYMLNQMATLIEKEQQLEPEKKDDSLTALHAALNDLRNNNDLMSEFEQQFDDDPTYRKPINEEDD